VDYDLSRLGNRLFEHLTQSLAVATLGPGVEVFGDGPDGGREASFEGGFDLQTGRSWDGYGVLQAKYKGHLEGASTDQAWFFGELRRELARWVRKNSRRRRLPRYLLLVTNVRLTGVADSGGIDKIDDVLAEFAEEGLKLSGYQVWHADKLRALLDDNYEIRRAYADLILPGDVIARLHDQLQESDRRVEHAWLGHAGRALLANNTVALGESGDAANTPLALEDVAVDLDAKFDDGSTETLRALAALVERGDNILTPQLRLTAKARIVVLGGPGQGKSTIGRILCQIYRAAMLSSREPSISSEVRDAATRIGVAFAQTGIPTPLRHRIPVYAPLPAYADEISGGSDVSLLRHLTKIINQRASERLGDSDMKKLLCSWPSLIVLDGLDEVAAPKVRTDLVDRITDFLGDMAANGSDILLVVTSRPQGFDDALPAAHYDHLVLQRLDEASALGYAQRLLCQRHTHNPDKQEMVVDRLRDAMSEPATAKLMETPLQVTIMTVLLESLSRPPRNRHGLFDRYYEVIYAREVNKPGPVAALLDRHREVIDRLHARAAFVLHRNAETAGDAESVMDKTEFRAMVRTLLDEDGWTEAIAEPLTDDLMRAATHRLVLIVPRREGIGFEVRSLQEFMAAKELTDGSDHDIPNRLEVLAPSMHWRNTVLLAAGRVVATRRPLRAEIITLIDRIDESSFCAMLAMPGASLAVDILDDGMAANVPQFEIDVLNSAMRLLDGPPSRDLASLADILHNLMAGSAAIKEAATRQVVKRICGPALSLGTLAFLSRLRSDRSGSVAEWARVHQRRLLERFPDADLNIILSIQDVPTPWDVMPSSSDERDMQLELLLRAAAEGLSGLIPQRSRGRRGKPSRPSHQAEVVEVLAALAELVITDEGENAADIRQLRDIAAIYARETEPVKWPVTIQIREALHEATGRDDTAAALRDITTNS
jgi:hypothetical protein